MKHVKTIIAALLAGSICTLLTEDQATGAQPVDRIQAFCIDFNWGAGGPNGFPAPGTFAQADPAVHYQWYRALGVNTIQTFCVSCNGYAWYQGSAVAPVQPGLKHDFLKRITELAHQDGVKVMGYFCVGANTYWGQKHPEQSYGHPSSIHIPFTNEYLDYLAASIQDALTKTGIDGFMIDWAFSPPLLMEEKDVRWLPCEQQMYAELFGRPHPGKDQVDAKETLEFQRRALERCWRRIHAAAKSAKPDCVIWLSCYDLSHPQVVGTAMLREVDWVMNETPTPEKLDATRQMVGPHARLIQCVSGGSTAYDASKVLDNPKYKEVGLYGFAPWPDPTTTLPPDPPQDATQKNIRANIEKLRRVYLPAASAAAGRTPAEALPQWAIGPFAKLDKPVLSPTAESTFDCPIEKRSVRWEQQNVYNPAAVVREGKVYLLYRADDGPKPTAWGRTCRIGVAWSEDGRQFTRLGKPVLYPDQDACKPFEWEGGCEDLHIVEDGAGTYFMNYTAWNGQRDALLVATSKDLIHWTKHGSAFAKFAPERVTGTRSGVVVSRREGDRLVATKLNGKYLMFVSHACALAESDNLIDWKPLSKAVWSGGQPGLFDSSSHEAGALALDLPDGILLFYNALNGGDPAIPATAWSLGQALLDRRDHITVLRRLDRPFLAPELDWELKGFTPAAVVANGLVPFQGEWLLYYGGADHHIGLATCRLDSLQSN